MRRPYLLALVLMSSGCAQLLDGDHEYVLGGSGGSSSGGATTTTSTTGHTGGSGGSTETTTSVACKSGEVLCAEGCVNLDADPQNCGYCEHDCDGAACSEGLCDPTLLTDGLCYPDSVDVDLTHVFFTTEANAADCPGSIGTVQRISKLGGSQPETIAKNLGLPGCLRLYQGHAYWADRLDRKVRRAGKNGVGLQTLSDAFPFLERIEVNALGVYVAQSWSDASGAGPGAIARVPLSGGPVTWIAEGLSRPHFLALSPDMVFFGGSAAADGATPEQGFIASVPLDGGDVTVVADNELDPQGVVVDADGVYWAAAKDKVLRKKVFQSGVVVTLAEGQEDVHSLAQDDTYIYWATLSGGVIARVAKSGGPVQILASGRQRPFSIAVFGKRIYWSESMPSGRVMSAPL